MTLHPSHEEVRQECLQLVAHNADLGALDRLLLREIVGNFARDLVGHISFVSPETDVKDSAGYTIEFANNGPYRVLVGRRWGHALVGMALDRHGRFLAKSNSVFHHPYRLVKLLPQLLEARSKALVEPAFPLDGQLVYTERWPPSYGHLFDEMCTTAAAARSCLDLEGYIPLVDYPTTDGGPGGPLLANAGQLAHAVFQGGALNLSAFDAPSLSVSRLALVGNRVTDPWFHRFPSGIIERIVSYIAANPLPGHDVVQKRFIFLTRRPPADLDRSIPMLQEIESAARARGFSVIDPATTPLPDLVMSLRAAHGMVCNWGGALTNVAFLQPQTRVGILKPPAYRSESLDMIFGNLWEEHPVVIRVQDASATESAWVEYVSLLDWVSGVE